jgi:DNA-binding transcriptional MocR family regulator
MIDSARQAELQARYDGFVDSGLKLDLTRGKPAAEQLDLANEMDGILEGFYLLQDGTDVRNYGGILGIPEARKLGADLTGVNPENIMVGGNSSLNLMYHYVNFMMETWRADTENIAFLCPVPGYDRHFTICEHFNIDMINVPLTGEGPDMDQVEALVKENRSIRGIWCVPKYSNPTGETYSDEVVKRMAALPMIAAPDFQVFWDNAYLVHDLEDETVPLANLFAEAKIKEATDGIVMLASTSKITFAGAGIAFLSTDTGRLASFEKYLSDQMIGFDKVNQLRHVRFLRDTDGITAHMAKHREIIKPKFDRVLEKLEQHLGGKDIARWTHPRGGYFISLDTQPGLASQIVTMAGAAGVKLTPAGATYPYGRDPDDSNIRIAPTFPSLDELDSAMNVFVTCVELATLNAVAG